MRPQLVAFLSHPIQHYTPWFAALGRRMGDDFRVIYSSRHGVDAARDPEFGETFAWDMDLLAGYAHEFEPNARRHSPGGGFWGIRFGHARERLRRLRPRAVMTFGWLFAGYWEAARAASMEEIPYLLRTESNALSGGSRLRWRMKDWTAGRLCRGAAGCLAIGTRNAELYRAYGVDPGRILMAPYFVDNDWFARETQRLRPRRAELRQSFGLPADALVFLFMGKLVAKKHPDDLLEAWMGLAPELKARSAVLFGGNGELASSLRERAAGEPRVAFAGFLNRSRLPEAYAASDVLVLPSDAGETWGLVVNEAMASGLATIVSDRVGCAPDLVDEGITGYVHPYGNLAAIRERLTACIRDPGGAASKGARGAERISLASVERSVDAVVEALDGFA
jgi:glycosyltransferase involved in cell wall biosynthesis